MRHVRHALLGAVLVTALAATGTASGALLPATHSTESTSVVLNEVQYDPEPSGGESRYEWVELLNVGSESVSLEGWSLADNRGSDVIPSSSMGPGEYLVVAADEAFRELFPEFDGRLVTVGGSIGNGLGNTGDQVRLLDATGAVVDGMSYGEDAGVLNPPVPVVAAGHSLERVPAGADADEADDWLDQPDPTPGRPAGIGRPTDPPPTDPPPTMSPGARVLLNEYMPAPRDVDWDGDGTAGKDDEWVEIYNAGDVTINLRGWQLDDVADGGSPPFVFPEGAAIAPRGYLVVFKRDSGLALNNGGDTVRLVASNGVEADVTEFRNAAADTSFSRDADGSGPWTDTLPPTPGHANRPAGGTPGPGPVPTSDPGSGPTPPPTADTSATPSASPTTIGTPSGTPTPAATSSGSATPVAPPGATATPTPADRLYLPILLTEVMFDPEAPGNDAALEWIELYNPNAEAVRLGGWWIGDRTAWDALPDVVVPGGGFIVVAASSEALGGGPNEASEAIVIADGRIGGGLANTGDVVRLRGPTGVVVDAVSYGANVDAFDPAVPIGSPGSSVERIPPWVDTDSAEDWWVQPAPSPGRRGQRHEGPPDVRLNEVLSAPSRVDWGGDGTADFTDEWLELYNASAYAVDLRDWRLVVGTPRRWSYVFPAGLRIEANAFLVVPRSVSDLALGNTADTVCIVRDDGVEADCFSWSTGAGYDRSWSRVPDGWGDWTPDPAPSPGRSNGAASRHPGPLQASAADRATPHPEPPREAPLGSVRTLGPGTRVRVRGRVTVAPGVFGEREAYVGDADSGVRLYLGPSDQQLPRVAEGAAVIATGVLKDFHGEREIVLDAPADLWVDGQLPIRPLLPRDIPTGAIGEHTEGSLVRLSGRARAFGGTWLVVDDGTGEARIVIRGATGLRRPFVVVGAPWTIVGVVTQYAAHAPWVGGYRVAPRVAQDLSAGTRASTSSLPVRWPATGRAMIRLLVPER